MAWATPSISSTYGMKLQGLINRYQSHVLNVTMNTCKITPHKNLVFLFPNLGFGTGSQWSFDLHDFSSFQKDGQMDHHFWGLR